VNVEAPALKQAGNKKKKQKQSQKKPKKKTGKARRARLRAMPILSNCAESYLRAIADPFMDFEQMPCIPDAITIPSYKYSAITRGVFTCASDGIGWCEFSPPMNLYSNTVATGTTTNYPVVYTNGTAPTTSMGFSVVGGALKDNNATNGVSGASSNSPFSDTSFTTTAAGAVQSRVVGAGLRVRYIGPELYRSGQIIMARAKTDASFITGQTSAILLKDTSNHSSPVTRQWRTITFIPANPTVLGYQNPKTYDPTIGTNPSQYVLCAYVDGAAIVAGGVPNPTFAFEAITFYEVIGPGFQVTRSHSDSIGYSAIQSAIPMYVEDGKGNQYLKMKAEAAKSMAYDISGMAQNAVTFASNAGILAGGAYTLLGRGNGRRPVVVDPDARDEL